MGLVKGGALRFLQTFLYAIIFCCAAIILGIYSYFLSVLADRHDTIYNSTRAVEGISGAGVLYSVFAVILTCCLGGIAFFAFLGLVLDVLFAGAFVAIAVMTRQGSSCGNGYVYTPLGNGNADSDANGFGGSDADNNVTYEVRLSTACRLNTAAFAVSIVAAILFIITAFMQIALVRHHKKEKRFGPSPSNNYTSGYGKRRFWQRKPKHAGDKEAELGTGAAIGAGAGGLAAHHHHDNRPSHETGYTGSTVAGSGVNGHDKLDGHQGTHGGYYTQPQGTGVNPYGYENSPQQNQYSTGTATNY